MSGGIVTRAIASSLTVAASPPFVPMASGAQTCKSSFSATCGKRSVAKLGKESFDMARNRALNPALGIGIRHSVPPQQELLVFKRQSRDLPAHGQALEQHLGPAPPGVVGRGRGANGRPLDGANRSRRERFAQPQD